MENSTIITCITVHSFYYCQAPFPPHLPVKFFRSLGFYHCNLLAHLMLVHIYPRSLSLISDMSSTLSHHSEQTLALLSIPLLTLITSRKRLGTTRSCIWGMLLLQPATSDGEREHAVPNKSRPFFSHLKTFGSVSTRTRSNILVEELKLICIATSY